MGENQRQPCERPSMWKYYHQVWSTAVTVDGHKWSKSTMGAIATTVLSTGITAILYGVDVSAKRPEWVVFGIVTIVLGIVWFSWCMLVSPYKLHCEQVDMIGKKQNELNDTRKEHYNLKNIVEEEPASLPQVQQLMHAFADKVSACESSDFEDVVDEAADFLAIALSARQSAEFANWGKEHQSMLPVQTRTAKEDWLRKTADKLSVSQIRHGCKARDLSKWEESNKKSG